MPDSGKEIYVRNVVYLEDGDEGEGSDALAGGCPTLLYTSRQGRKSKGEETKKSIVTAGPKAGQTQQVSCHRETMFPLFGCTQVSWVLHGHCFR